MPSIVMTLMGDDRPGLVESLAAVVAAHQANWLESRMAHLAGQFAGILQIEVDSGQVAKLVEALEKLDEVGLTVFAKPDDQTSTVVNDPQYAPIQLDLMGNDRPGIVREVTRVLAELDVNVEDFRTECKMAPMSGGPLFHAHAELRLPPGLTRTELETRLEEIAGDLMVDIRIKKGE